MILFLGPTVLFKAGPRPRQVRSKPKAPPKNKIFLKKNAPLFIVKSPNFYKIIYIFSKGCTFFFISDVNDTTNFTIGLQIVMLLTTK